MKPVVIDLCCGLGGWSAGFLAEGWDAIGFDIEKHEYGDKRYPGELILRDITQICGYDLRAVSPALVVASPPCQNYSYMAMPWTRAKAMAAAIRDNPEKEAELNRLFDACFRIARELGVPIVLENVKGAQPWVGRAQAHYGSYYLWGDVEGVGGAIVRARGVPKFGETLRVRTGRKSKVGSWDLTRENYTSDKTWNSDGQKRDGRNFHAFENGLGSSPSFNGGEHETRGVKQPGLSGPLWFDKGAAQFQSAGKNRKAASAMIAEIPFDLASYIARVFKPS